MSEPKFIYGEEFQPVPNNSVNLGKYWAALREDNVIGIISMRIPNDVDFEKFREKAVVCLGMLGDVKSGEVVERDGERYFVQRLTHANRGKKPRTPKEYLIYRPRGGRGE